MRWVILHGRIPNLFKHVDPDNHLVKYIPQNNGLAIATRLFEPPSFLDAIPFGAFCEHLEVWKDVHYVLTTVESELLPIAGG